MLRQIRSAVRKAAPKAVESISYGMPYYNQNGRVAYFAAFANHCSFFWLTKEDKKVFAKDLSKFVVKGSTLHIPQGSKVPASFIQKIVRAKLKRNSAKAQKKA